MDSQIDEQLRPYTTVPLSSTPTEVGKISALWAAGSFRKRRSPEQEALAQALVAEAKDRLLRYIEANYLNKSGGTFTPSGGLTG